MIPDIIGQTTGRFGRRFFLTALVPTAVFAPATALIVLVATDQASTLLNWYSRLSPVSQVLGWLTVAGGIWFLATLLATQSGVIIKLYEGYLLVWVVARLNRLLPDDSALVPPGVVAHQRRRARLAIQAKKEDAEGYKAPAGAQYEDSAVDLLYDKYPADHERVLPTSFGNVIRSAEDYAEDRYGFDVIQLWPRLSVVLPPEYLVDYETTMIEYETPLMISFGMATVAASSLGLVGTTITTNVFVAIFVGTSIASWIAYRLSVTAVRDYGDLMCTAVDLYRTDLLEKWWPELLEIEDDRRRLEALREFVITGKKSLVEQLEAAKPAAGRPSTKRGGKAASNPGASGAARKGARSEEKGEGNKGNKGEVDLERVSARRGIRIWVWLAAAVTAVCIGGVLYMDMGRPVLVADGDIGAFSYIGDDDVNLDTLRRGSVGHEAVSPDGEDLPDNLAGYLVLRDIPNGAVIRSSDLGPTRTRSGVVVELIQPTSQVDALDLGPGDHVLLDGNDGSTTTVCPSNAYVEGDVLSLRDGPSLEVTSVLVQVPRLHAQRCLGDLEGVAILRDTD